MPQRRTRDVIQVIMTDHLIQRRAGGEERVAPLKETTPIITDVEFLDPQAAPKGALGEVYRAVTTLRAATDTEAVQWLERQLPLAKIDSVIPYLDLAKGQLKLQRYGATKATLKEVLRREPGHGLAVSWLGLVALATNDTRGAERLLRESLAIEPHRPESHYNLGLTLIRQRRYEEAAAQLREAVELRPIMPRAWFYLGKTQAAMNRDKAALASYERSLALAPTFGRTYLSLAEVLIHMGRKQEALRYLRHGARVASPAAPIKAALAELTTN
jgi:tetratricopeptide (TPR) repeat protein